jgi:putative DNA primase/helicase
MSAKENPGVVPGALEETAGGAVPGVDNTSTDRLFPLTPADEARARAADAAAIVAYDEVAARREAAELARAGADNPRLNRDGIPYAKDIADLSKIVCDHYLRESQIPMLRKVSPDTVRLGLLGRINDAIKTQNEQLKRDLVVGKKLIHLTRLDFTHVARLVEALADVRLLVDVKGSEASQMLGAYDGNPASEHYGIYRTSPGYVRMIARRYQPTLNDREYDEVARVLAERLTPVKAVACPELIAVNNGIFDYRRQQLLPFSSEHVFLSKTATRWNPDAQNPHIQTPHGDVWDVESWMSSLSDDPEIVDLLWAILGAVTRPNVAWNKAVFPFSVEGNNGKGTYLEVARGLLGEANWVSIPLATIGEKFGLSELRDATVAQAILVDENPVGTFIDRADHTKALITGDAVRVEGKGTNGVSMHWRGMMIQCLNDLPRVKDRSPSFLRRLLIIPFTKSFKGVERKYIKEDYLTRPEVLEYILKRVLSHDLTPAYYELPEPLAVKVALDEFQEQNDPVLEFWNEMETQFYWGLVPFAFIYDLYKAWLDKRRPGSKPLGYRKFVDELVPLVNKRSEQGGRWVCKNKRARHRPGTLMAATEPLIAEYDLLDWANVGARNDPRRFARIPADKLKESYTGLRCRELTDDDFAHAGSAAAVTKTDTAGDTVVGAATTPPTDPLTVGPMAIPEDGAPGPAGQPAASSDDADAGAPAPEAPVGDVPTPARTLSPERAARLADMGVLSGTAKSEGMQA